MERTLSRSTVSTLSKISVSRTTSKNFPATVSWPKMTSYHLSRQAARSRSTGGGSAIGEDQEAVDTYFPPLLFQSIMFDNLHGFLYSSIWISPSSLMMSCAAGSSTPVLLLLAWSLMSNSPADRL